MFSIKHSSINCKTNVLHISCTICNTINKKYYGVQNIKTFKIPNVPHTTSKTIRFPNDVIAEVETAIKGKDCTFTAFVVEAVRVALDNLKEE